jgi:hypothetical protein
LISHVFNFRKKELKTLYLPLVILWLVIFAGSVLLMLPVSLNFYKYITKYFTIDIPWRFLIVNVFASSFLFGLVILFFKNKILKFLYLLLIVLIAFYGNRNHIRVNKYVYIPDSEYRQSTETSNEYEDYAPIWFNTNKAEDRDKQLVIYYGDSDNELIERKSNLLRFHSQVKNERSLIITKIAYYPGWQVYVDGKKEKVIHKDGKILVDLKKGDHLVTLVFKNTPLRTFSNWLSLSTLVLILIFLLKFSYQDKLSKKKINLIKNKLKKQQ